jgi:hypothetical protein
LHRRFQDNRLIELSRPRHLILATTTLVILEHPTQNDNMMDLPDDAGAAR